MKGPRGVIRVGLFLFGVSGRSHDQMIDHKLVVAEVLNLEDKLIVL